MITIEKLESLLIGYMMHKDKHHLQPSIYLHGNRPRTVYICVPKQWATSWAIQVCLSLSCNSLTKTLLIVFDLWRNTTARQRFRRKGAPYIIKCISKKEGYVVSLSNGVALVLPKAYIVGKVLKRHKRIVPKFANVNVSKSRWIGGKVQPALICFRNSIDFDRAFFKNIFLINV